nr:hypothetical protein [Sagittula marina]
MALKLVAECGTDLRAWKSAKHFTSWLCSALGNKISGASCYPRGHVGPSVVRPLSCAWLP